MRTTITTLALLAFAATAHAEAAKPAAAPPRPAAKAAKAAPGKGTAAAKAVVPGKAGTRRLDDIQIEGEIPVPQVLFITAREQRRVMDFQHHRYLKPSAKVGAETALPTWIAITGNPPVDARKEPSR